MRSVCKVGVVILLASFFLMSHNASAFDINIPVTLKDTIKQPYISYNYVGGSAATAYSNAQVIRYTNSPNITRIFFKDTSNNNIAFNSGDYIVFNFYIDKSEYYVGDFYGRAPFAFVSTIGSNPSCDIISIDFNEQEYISGGITSFVDRYNGTITCRTNSSGTNPSINLLVRSNLLSLDNPVESIRFSFSSMSIYSPVEQHDVNAEQQQATQNAADDSETQAEDNSSNAQTSNLIGVLRQFSTALTALQPTNCNVTLAWPSALGGNMRVNLCQNKNYAGNIISVFGSLTLIVFYIPFSLKLLSMIYNEIRSFTNG